MATKNVHVEYTADSDSAVAGTERLKGSIAGLTDKTTRLRVITEEQRINRWAGGLDRAAGSADRAGRASDRLGERMGRSGDRAREAARGVDDFDSSLRRSEQSARDLDASTSRLGSTFNGTGGGIDTAVGRLERLQAATSAVADAQSRAQTATREFSDAYAKAYDAAPSNRVADKKMFAEQATMPQRAAMDEASTAFRRAEQDSRDLRQGLKEVDRESRGTRKGLGDLARGLGDVGDGTGGAARGLGGVSGPVGRVAGVLGNATGAASTFAQVLGYSAAGSGILTAAVGALGVAGVGTLGGIGAAAGLAGGAMANFAVDAHQDSARFGKTLEQLGKQSHLASQFISEPLTESIVGAGRALVTAENQMTPAGMAIAQGLRGGFRNAADVVSGSTDDLVDAAAIGAAGFDRLTGEAAPGVSAWLSQLPSLTQGAVDGMSQMTSEFGRSADEIEGATPSLNRMTGAAGGLGAELTSIGADNLGEFAEDVRSMLGGATQMARDLAPAVRPSMTAFTDVMNAGMGGVGSLGSEIAGFAGTVSKNAAPIESIVDSVGRGMLSLGGATVEGVSQASPAIDGLADSLENSQGSIASLVGGGTRMAAQSGAMATNALGTATKAARRASKSPAGKAVGKLAESGFGITEDPSTGFTGIKSDMLTRLMGGSAGLPGQMLGAAAMATGMVVPGDGGAGGGATVADWAGPGGIPGQFSGIGMSMQTDEAGNVSPSVATRSGGRAVDKPVTKEQLGLVKELQNRIDSPAATEMQKSWAESKQADVARGITTPESMRKQLDSLAPLPKSAPPDPRSAQPGQLPLPGQLPGQKQPFNIADTINARQGNAAAFSAGQSVPQGAAAGINAGAGAPAAAAKNMAGRATQAARREWETRSPSRVFYRWGMSGPQGATNAINDGAGMLAQATTGMARGAVDGFGSAMGGLGGASGAALGKAAAQLSDRALPLGYVWGENLVTGAAAVIKKANFEAAGTPTVENTDSRAWLAAMGYLGPGAGAAVDKTRPVSFGAQTVNLTVPMTVQVGEEPIQRIARTVSIDVTDGRFAELDDALVGARG